MSFSWLDDDEIAVEQNAYGEKSRTKSQQPANKNNDVYFCPNCGSSRSYLDDTTGLQVCSDCFTAHLQSQQETTEIEELQQFAAKSRHGGGFLATSVGTVTKGTNHRWRKQLDEFNHSTALPELEPCLQAMKVVLVECTKIICRDILPNLPHPQPSFHVLTEQSPRRLLQQTVRDLWRSYLRSWADGAQRYGTLYPHARFCYRDSFLTLAHKDLLGKFLEQKHIILAHQTNDDNDNSRPATTTATAAVGNHAPPVLTSSSSSFLPNEDEPPADDIQNKRQPKKKVTFNVQEKGGNIRYPDDDDDDDDDNDDGIMDDEDKVADSDDDDDSIAKQDIGGGGEAAEYSAQTARSDVGRITQFGFLQTLIYKHCREHKQSFDAPTAALLIRPSMHLVAAILLLALQTNNVILPTFEFLRWIESGKLPLKTAYDDLIPSSSSSSSSRNVALKQHIRLVAGFFRSFRPVSPSKFDRIVTVLAVACRIKSHAYEQCYRRKGCFTFIAHQFIWHGPHTLALRMAQLAAAAGLPRRVLDRALQLVDLPPTAEAALVGEDRSNGNSSSSDNDDGDDDDSDRDDDDNSSATSSSSDDSSNSIPTPVPQGDASSSTTKPTTTRAPFDFMAPNTIQAIPQVAHPQDVSTPEDILALLAIACQFDPAWREWKYYKTTSTRQHFVMPHNETELLNMDHPDRYLKQCYEKMFVAVRDYLAANSGTKQEEHAVPIPKHLFREGELKAGGDDDASAVSRFGDTDQSIVVSSNGSIDESSRGNSSGRKANQKGPTKGLEAKSAKGDTPNPMGCKSDGGESSDNAFGGHEETGTNDETDGFGSDEDIFGGLVQKGPTKTLKGGTSDGYASDDLFGGSTKKPMAAQSRSSDVSERDRTKELLAGNKRKREDDAKDGAVLPESKVSKQNSARRKRAVSVASESDDLSTSSSIDETATHDDDDEEEAWGLKPLKPATLLKRNDIVCGISLSPECKEGGTTKRLRDDNTGKAAPQQQRRRPRADFSKCNLDHQWMDASLPRVDPKLLQLLQHLAYSADLTTIDLVEDLMVYYLQGRGIARHTFRKPGATVTVRRTDRTKKRYVCVDVLRFHSRFCM
jgi:ribosomal protein L37AE/L43A